MAKCGTWFMSWHHWCFLLLPYPIQVERTAVEGIMTTFMVDTITILVPVQEGVMVPDLP